MFRVYLSGSMAGQPVDVVRETRGRAIRECAKYGIFAVDPGASEQKLWSKKNMRKITLRFDPRIMEAFVKEDCWLIRRCDALLVLTGDTPSDGTWWEMSYAKWIGLPVVMIAPQRVRGSLVGWSNIQIADVVEDLQSAVKLIKRKYVKEYIRHKAHFDKAIRNAEVAFGKKRRKRTKKRSRRRRKKSRRR